MKRYITFFVILTLFSNSSIAQITWDTKIDYENTEQIGNKQSFLKLQDGNYLFMYWRLDEPVISTNNFTHVLAKFDTDGELIWEKLYDHNIDFTAMGLQGGLDPRGMVQMPTEEIVVIGRALKDYIGYLYVVDTNGDSLLYQTYPQYKVFRNIRAISDNEITVSASLGGDKEVATSK